MNDNVARRVHTPRLPFDVDEVPNDPPANALPLESLDDTAKQLIAQLRALFDRRPAWTRRALVNQLDREKFATAFRYSFQYVAYMFRSGPWRESLIKLGVDPRRDPNLRMYQTMFFQFDIEEKTAQHANRSARGGARTRGTGRQSVYAQTELGERSHIFEGTTVGFDGRVWQVCDITDPLISSILSTPQIRTTCHVRLPGV